MWKVGRATSLLLGKRTPRNRVDIDVSEGIYSNLVSRAHGILNKVNGVWYYEDLASQKWTYSIAKKNDYKKAVLKTMDNWYNFKTWLYKYAHYAKTQIDNPIENTVTYDIKSKNWYNSPFRVKFDKIGVNSTNVCGITKIFS